MNSQYARKADTEERNNFGSESWNLKMCDVSIRCEESEDSLALLESVLTSVLPMFLQTLPSFLFLQFLLITIKAEFATRFRQHERTDPRLTAGFGIARGSTCCTNQEVEQESTLL